MLCAGCGHRTAMMILDEIIKKKKLKEKVILALDVACCSLLIDFVDYDSIMCPHGRVLDVTKGYKTMRNENIVISYMGDGAAYSIGIEEMIHSARRGDDALIIVINNGLYSMTGGQKTVTYISASEKASDSIKTTCSVGGVTERSERIPRGNTASPLPVGASCASPLPVGADSIRPHPFTIETIISQLPITYLARAALTDSNNLNLAKTYIEKAFDNYMTIGGFNMVELLSPCPTNYKLSPKDMTEKINNEWTKIYKIGELKTC